MHKASGAVTIGVLSDTHASSIAEISPRILEALASVDLIVHAGDFVTRDVLEGLKKLKPVTAVRGNMDSQEVTALLPDKEVFSVGGRKIGVTHGSGGPSGIARRVRALFDEVDVVIYGHSHVAQNEVIDGVLFFNPGRARESFGILTIGEEVRGETIPV
ncbi:MAG: hypothetical protein DRI39_06095 [Chloroflexi bacterium]|nr:MAG: hypothetical protein DRI39_06095 [Chloroflexota bacterium]